MSGAFDPHEAARTGAGPTTSDLRPAGSPATPGKNTLTAGVLPRTTSDMPPAGAPVQKQAAAMDTAAAAVPAATPRSSAASAAAEDGRVSATAPGPQLAQHGHAMQYYHLHQPAFLDAVRTRLLAADLPPGSPQLSWPHGPARFVEQLRFALTGPEASELPELLHPSDPWALIDAHRTMDADPTLATGAMGWSPAAGLALATAFERSVRASLPRVAARYVAERGTRSASLLVAAHPMDRVVAEALVTDGVVALGANRVAETGKADGAATGYDVQTGGIRLVMSYRWLGDVDPTLWHWLSVDDPADATLEEIAFAVWNRTEYAYGLTRVGGYVAVPRDWARQVPGVQVREAHGGVTLDRFDRSPVEELAASKLADRAALAQGAHAMGDAAQATSATARTGADPDARDSAPDRTQLLDALDATSVILDALTRQLGPWGLAYVLDAGRSFVARQRAALPGATPDTLALWAPVITGQRAIVRDAATGLLEVQSALAEAGVAPDQLSARDRAQNAHPGLQVLYGYAQAAGTAQLGESARTVLAQARAAHGVLPVTLIARASQDAGRALSQLSHAGEDGAGGPAAAARARSLGADHAQLAGEVATLESQVMASGRPDPVLLETAGLDAETLAFRARIAQLQASLSALGHALDAADQGVIAALAHLSAGARMVMTGHHLDLASQALGEVETTLDTSQPAAVNARYDAMPPSPAREYGRQFELRDTRKAQLARAHERFATIARAHGLDGAIFQEAEHAMRDAQIRALVANVAVLVAAGVISGGVAAVAGDFAAGLVGGGRAVTAIAESTGALRTARVVGGVTNVVVDAGANAAAQTALTGDHLGSSFAENLLSNAAVRAALGPLHAAIRTWGGLDEEALALWTQQGARGKLALARTAVISAELVTTGATSYVVHRLTTLARGEKPDDETIATWAVQGATLVLARLIHTRLDAVMERLQGAGTRAGELVARAARQQARTLAYQSTEAIGRGAAMQLLIEHQQLTRDEIDFWRGVAADPAATRTLGIDGQKAAARLAAAEAQSTELQGPALHDLPLRLAGLEQEVEGSRLWVGDAEQIAHGLANARDAGLPLSVKPPPSAGAAEPASDAGVPATRIWHVNLGGDDLEIRERVSAGRVRGAVPDAATAHTGTAANRYDGKSPAELTPAELESRGAHPVPGARFSGLATQGDPKAKITPEQAIERAHDAVTILDGVNQEFLSIDRGGSIWVSVGPESCLVDITVGDAMADVAQHTYTRAAKHARIKISEHARLEDVTRAVAHELAEIRGLMGDATLQVTDKPALARGSTADKMQHHDLGRRAELQILRYELESQPSRRAEIVDEIEKLVEHLGLDKSKIGADARARKMLGDPVVKGIDQMNGRKRLKVTRSAVHEPQSKVERGNWEFNILVDLPGGQSLLIAQGHTQVDIHGRPTSGPDFSFDKRVQLDGSEFRVDIEGIPSLTDWALDEGMKAFKKDFGHPPDELPGSLADDNKAIFQKEYAVQIEGGATPDAAGQRAAARTPFVAARAKKGYTKVKVEPSAEMVNIVNGHPPRVHQVPARIHVTARKP